MMHTPTPWSLIPASCGYIYAMGNSSNDVIRVETKNPDNAAFIVRAVNAHDELVAAVQAFAKYDDDDHTDGVNTMINYGDAITKCRAVLAKVTA